MQPKEASPIHVAWDKFANTYVYTINRKVNSGQFLDQGTLWVGSNSIANSQTISANVPLVLTSLANSHALRSYPLQIQFQSPNAATINTVSFTVTGSANIGSESIISNESHTFADYGYEDSGNVFMVYDTAYENITSITANSGSGQVKVYSLDSPADLNDANQPEYIDQGYPQATDNTFSEFVDLKTTDNVIFQIIGHTESGNDAISNIGGVVMNWSNIVPATITSVTENTSTLAMNVSFTTGPNVPDTYVVNVYVSNTLVTIDDQPLADIEANGYINYANNSNVITALSNGDVVSFQLGSRWNDFVPIVAWSANSTPTTFLVSLPSPLTFHMGPMTTGHFALSGNVSWVGTLAAPTSTSPTEIVPANVVLTIWSGANDDESVPNTLKKIALEIDIATRYGIADIRTRYSNVTIANIGTFALSNTSHSANAYLLDANNVHTDYFTQTSGPNLQTVMQWLWTTPHFANGNTYTVTFTT